MYHKDNNERKDHSLQSDHVIVTEEVWCWGGSEGCAENGCSKARQLMEKAMNEWRYCIQFIEADSPEKGLVPV